MGALDGTLNVNWTFRADPHLPPPLLKSTFLYLISYVLDFRQRYWAQRTRERTTTVAGFKAWKLKFSRFSKDFIDKVISCARAKGIPFSLSENFGL